MKSLAQICIAMAEAGIRLQTGEDVAAARGQRHTLMVEDRQAMMSERPATVPALRGLEQDPASTTE